MYSRLFVIGLFVVVLVFASGHWRCGEALQKDSSSTRKNQLDAHHCDTFFHIRYHVNGEEEYRAALHGRILIMVRNSSRHESAVQMTDGQSLVKLHYNKRHHEESAATCDLIGCPAAVASFLREFHPVETSTSDHDLARGACVRGAGHIVDEIGGRAVDLAEWSVRGINLRILRDDVQQQCGDDQNLAAFMQKLDESISSVSEHEQYENERSAVRRRGRRSLRLIMPGTRWCGTGNVSTDGDSHGNILATDRCCQQHDRCPHTIGSFSRNYGLFNYRLHTISHCECDDVFRSCLRTVGSQEANMVGRLFFNVIGVKCFVLRVQRQSECVERSWWGRCTRQEMVSRRYAELRGPLNF